MRRSCQSDGIIYLNLSLSNPANSTFKKPVIFEAINNTVIVDRPSDYLLQIVKWSVPSDLIPKMKVKINDLNTLETPYAVSMTAGGFTDTENLIFVPDDLTAYNTEDKYYNYYDIQEFIDITNTALLNSYSAVFGNDGTFPAVNFAPFIAYDVSVKRYRLYVYNACLTHAPPLEISFNGCLQTIFKLPNIIAQNDIFNLIIKNRLTNSITAGALNGYIYVESSYVSDTAPTLQKILISVDYGLSINQEYIKGSGQINASSQTVAKSIITDFDIDHTADNSQYLQYQTSGINNARLVQVSSGEPVKIFSISVSYVDNENNIYPVLMMSNTYSSIKLCWVPRSYISNFAGIDAHAF